MQQRAELVARQRLEIEADEMTVALQAGQPRRRGAPGAHGADQEHGAGHDQRDEDGDGRVVEQVEVVDEQDEPVVTGQPAQLGPGAVEQRRALVVADAEVGHERAGSRWASAPSGIACVAGVADGPLHPPAGSLGPAQRLLGEAGLADAGRTLQHDAATRTVAVVTAELLELGRPPGERPG